MRYYRREFVPRLDATAQAGYVPEDFLPVLGARQDTGDDEQQVRQTVEITPAFRIQLFLAAQGHEAALGTAALPSLLVRSGVTSSVEAQRHSSGWAP